MAYNNSIITKPVSIYDVQRALGNSSPDLGTLCSYYGIGPAADYTPYGINKWATFKPVKVQGVGPLSKQTLVTLQFGLTLLSNTTLSGGLTIENAMSVMRGQSSGPFMTPYMPDLVAYTPPSGTQASPYRLTDFAYAWSDKVGYDARARLRYSYKDNENKWHGLVMRYGYGTVHEVSLTSDNVEDLNAEMDWVNYTDASLASILDANLTPLQDSILIHDLMANYRLYNKGIAFMNSPTDEEFIAFVGSLDWGNQKLRNIIADSSVETTTFEFLTDAQSGVYTQGGLDSKRWVAIPGCGGEVKSSGGGSFTIIAVLGGSGYIINPESVDWRFDISAVILKINFNDVGIEQGARKYVQLVLADSAEGMTTEYGSAVTVYDDTYEVGTEIAYPLRDEAAKGKTLFLNIVGKVSSTTQGVLWSREITLGT